MKGRPHIDRAILVEGPGKALERHATACFACGVADFLRQGEFPAGGAALRKG